MLMGLPCGEDQSLQILSAIWLVRVPATRAKFKAIERYVRPASGQIAF